MMIERLTLFQPDFNRTVDVIKDAFDVGYRHIDTAKIYRTEAAVGKAVKDKIQEGIIKREDVFITTKVNIGYIKIHKCFIKAI